VSKGNWISMQNKFEERAFFDEWTESKEYDVLTQNGYDTIIRDFRRLIGNRLLKGRRAIDLGCGTGAFTRKLFQDSDAELFGLDISENAINLAKKNEKKIKFIVGDTENLQFEESYFDLVVFSGILHHFPDEKKCLAEGYRVLKKGGCMISYDPNKINPFMWLYRDPSSPFFSTVGKTENEKLLYAQDLNKLMKTTGFINVDTHCIGGVTFKTVESRVGRLLLPIYNILERFMGILPFAKKYGSFLICYGEKNGTL
jgi:ubiquinone/menaquinone biosynthesis C-methylase UbiE